MDFAERLLLLLDVIESGSFVGASEHRQINRSVVSKQISKLEKELGVRLLNRTTRSLSLTAAGQEMLNQARRLRSLLDETRTLAQHYHQEPIGSLRITSTSDFGRRYVQQAVIAFQHQYPSIDIEFRLDDRMQDLVAEGFDLGFRTGKPKDSSLIARKLARNRLLIVASPSFLARHGEPKTISELERLPSAVYSYDGQTIDRVKYYDPQGAEAHIRLKVAYKTNELEMLKNAALEGNMVSVLTAQTIGNEVLEGKLIPIMTHLPLADFGTFYVVYPHRDLPLKTRLFLEVLKTFIGGELPLWEKRIPHFEAMYRRQQPG
ncbi:LysR family transcriptional regulator [Ferrimonas sp.]|uniref:LysR family transcriptional regulator n=1 Tax=Ferrimonas sp. TaxID=2080861 RepID=UPI003A9369FE